MLERQVIFLRKLFAILVAALICAFLISVIPFLNSCEELSEDVLRIHILANSDSAADQSLKLAVRDRVLEHCSAYFDDCEDKNEALAVTRDKLGEIEEVAAGEIRAQGFDYPVKAEVGQAYFNTRHYEDFTMPAGWYDSLRLTIGDGDGRNWWCVMYPALCVGAACEEKMKEDLNDGEYRVVTSDQLDFRFKLVEYWESICSLFR